MGGLRCVRCCRKSRCGSALSCLYIVIWAEFRQRVCRVPEMNVSAGVFLIPADGLPLRSQVKMCIEISRLDRNGNSRYPGKC